MSLNDDLIKLIKSLPRIKVQNFLMAVPDREIALSMMYMKDSDRNYLLAAVSGKRRKGLMQN